MYCPTIRGAGPTTTAAVTRYQNSGEIYATSGDTNGALMRILPAGWAIPATHARQRRDVVARLTRVTHGAPVAVAAACAIAAMASYAVDGCAARELVTVALREPGQVLGEHAAAAVPLQTVSAAADGSWRPGPAGVSLHAAETLAAVVHVLAQRGDDLDGAVRYAVSLGGDTDTVASITAGILGCRSAEPAIGWLDRVILPDPAELDRLASGLRELRRARAMADCRACAIRTRPASVSTPNVRPASGPKCGSRTRWPPQTTVRSQRLPRPRRCRAQPGIARRARQPRMHG